MKSSSQRHLLNAHSYEARYVLSSQRMWNIKDDMFDHRHFYRAIVMRLSDKDDPCLVQQVRCKQHRLTGTDYQYSRVFGDERGRIDASAEEGGEEWYRFKNRMAARKAVQRATNAREAILAST